MRDLVYIETSIGKNTERFR